MIFSQMEGSAAKTLGANTSEGVLANFFNSLLSKKTGGGGAAGGVAGSPGGPQLPLRTDGTAAPDDCKFYYLFFSFLWSHIGVSSFVDPYFYQCCGSGIRCLFDSWIRDGFKIIRIWDPDPG
jgi:hypothetical protein